MDDKNRKYTHVSVTDKRGRKYLCPVGTENRNSKKGVDVNVCFERDVPGRYAARINVRET